MSHIAGYADHLAEQWGLEHVNHPDMQELKDRHNARPGYHEGEDFGPNGTNVGWVKTQHLLPYREYMRRTTKDANPDSDKVIESIKDDLKSGRGWTDPISLSYDHKTHRALVDEGNHRLQAALEAGHEHVPVVVNRAYKSAVDRHKPALWGRSEVRRKPDAYGYVASQMPPNAVLPDYMLHPASQAHDPFDYPGATDNASGGSDSGSGGDSDSGGGSATARLAVGADDTPWFVKAPLSEITSHPVADSLLSEMRNYTSATGHRYRLHHDPSWGIVRARYMGREGKPDVKRSTAAGELTYNKWSGDNKGEVGEVRVGKPHQRKGLATAMLHFARQQVPDMNVRHSTTLLPDGKAWAGATPNDELPTQDEHWQNKLHPLAVKSAPKGLTFEHQPAIAIDENGPRGATSHQITAHLPSGERVGVMHLSGMPEYYHARTGGQGLHPSAHREVEAVNVPAKYRRQGIATAMWEHAKEIGLNPMHSALQFDDGKAWAGSVDPHRTYRDEEQMLRSGEQIPQHAEPREDSGDGSEQMSLFGALEEDYHGAHEAPSGDEETEAPIHDIERVMPDFYAHPEWYGSPREGASHNESVSAIRAANGRPEGTTRVYRAVPHGVDTINKGDWVTPSKAYAQQHARSVGCPECGKDMAVVHADVKNKHLWNEGYPTEFGYIGPSVSHRGTAKEAAKANEISVSGVLVKAKDTGRVLLLQRDYTDESDPARGTWEAPGGHVEDGESPWQSAKREWAEETGQPFPAGGVIQDEWLSSPIYQMFLYVIPREDMIELHVDSDQRVINPDDPDGDNTEALAWFTPEQISDNHSMRPEFRAGMNWHLLRKA